MQPEKPSNSAPLFGLIFIAAIFTIIFFLVRPIQSSSLPSADELSILYLGDEREIPVDSYRHPDVLRRDLSRNLQVIDEGVEAAAALEPSALEDLDVLIVDQTALSFVNPEDITNAYDASVVVFGLNIPVTELSRLVDDTRLTTDNFAADPYSGDFFIYIFQSVTGQNQDEVARVDQAARTGSDEVVPGITEQVSSQFSKGQNNLETEQDLKLFTAVLTNRAADRP